MYFYNNTVMVPKKVFYLDPRVKSKSSAPPHVGVPKFNICTVNGQNYTQAQNPNGTYSLSRINFSPTGFSVTGLSFNTIDLTQAKIPYYVFTPLTFKNSEWGPEGLFADPHLIIDNRQWDRKVLLNMAKSVSIGMSFKKITKPKVNLFTAGTHIEIKAE